MANIFDTSRAVTPVTQNETPIQQGVQDNTVANAISGVTDLAMTSGANLMAATAVEDAVEEAEVELAQQTQEQPNIFADPAGQEGFSELPENEQRELQNLNKELNSIANGLKAGMREGKAKLLARQKVAQKLNAAATSPELQRAIRRQAQASGLLGSPSAGQAQKQTTPQQKANKELLDQVSTLSAQTGYSPERSLALIREQARYKQRQNLAESNTDRIYAGVNVLHNNVYNETIVPVLKNNPDGLQPDMLLETKSAVQIEVNQWKQQQIAQAQEGGYLTKSYKDEVDAEAKEALDSYNTLIDNQSLRTRLARDTQLMENMSKLDTMGTSYLSRNLEQGSLTPDEVDTIIKAAEWGDQDAIEKIKSDPSQTKIYSQYISIENRVHNLKTQAGIKMMGGENPAWDANHSGADPTGQGNKDVNKSGMTPQEQNQGWAQLIKSPKGPDLLNQTLDKENNNVASMAGDVAKQEPNSVALWTNKRIKPVIKAKGEKGLEVVSNSMNNATRGIAAQMYNDGWDGDLELVRGGDRYQEINGRRTAASYMVQGRQTTSTSKQVEIRGLPEAEGFDTGRSPYYRSVIQKQLRVARDYPELWEDNYESAEQYVEEMINGNIGKTPEQRAEARRRAAEARQAEEQRVEQEQIDFLSGNVNRAKKAKPTRQDLRAVKQFRDAGYELDEVLQDYDEAIDGQGGPTADTRAERKRIINAWNQLESPQQSEDNTEEGDGGGETVPQPNVGQELSSEQNQAQLTQSLRRLLEGGFTESEILSAYKERNPNASDEDIQRIEDTLMGIDIPRT